MKLVSIIIVVVFGTILLIHYYRRYYNYTQLTQNIKWPCEVDELGKCVEKIPLNQCPDFWQLSVDGNTKECKNIHKICPSNNLNCNISTDNDSQTSVGFDMSDKKKCEWVQTNHYTWDGITGNCNNYSDQN